MASNPGTSPLPATKTTAVNMPLSLTSSSSSSLRMAVHDALDASSSTGLWYQRLALLLIVANVLSFIIGTTLSANNNNDNNDNSNNLGVSDNNHESISTTTWCNEVCDALWFGIQQPNRLLADAVRIPQLQVTSVLELVLVLIFSTEYLLRLWTADLSHQRFRGWMGRIRYILRWDSLIDIGSLIPFYIDVWMWTDHNFQGATFLRILRLFRMMRINKNSPYETALSMMDDVFVTQKSILATAAFVGVTVWMVVSTLLHVTERRNLRMIQCPTCPDITIEDCNIDMWGLVDCSEAGCPNHIDSESSWWQSYPCFHIYESIPMASYYALLNLLGEFPILQQHSTAGKCVCTLTTVIAVAFFALPAGIIGNGLEQVIEAQRQQREQTAAAAAAQQQSEETPKDTCKTTTETITTVTAARTATPCKVTTTTYTSPAITYGYIADPATSMGQWYNLLHAQPPISSTAIYLDYVINGLIVLTAIAFMLDTVITPLPPTTTTTTTGLSNNNNIHWTVVSYQTASESLEITAVILFTIEYVLRVYAVKVDPMYQSDNRTGRWRYMITFLSLVDLFSILPFWIHRIMITILRSSLSTISVVVAGGGGMSALAIMIRNSHRNHWVKALRLLRILRFERYTTAFTSFDNVIVEHANVLAVTALTAILLWILFAALLYYTERNNPVTEMAQNYQDMPHAMWMTLLNLSGESPLCQYSTAGKVLTGLLGLFATGIFGIPIGVLGAGFEEVVEERQNDLQEEEEHETKANTRRTESQPVRVLAGTHWEQVAYRFVNGIGSIWATVFEVAIYGLIFLAVAVGIWQTVEGQENTFHEVEWIAVMIFSVEYIIRLVGVGSDPEFAKPGRGSIACRLHFIVSFYSVIDLLAIIPFYLSMALPNSFVNEYDEYLRMLRILRLLKLDKYIPSITLIDDVFRLKAKTLKVAFYAAFSLWILFAAAMFLSEHDDTTNEIDAVPEYGCVENCTMSYRFKNFFDSMVYTGIHLTGDYPITNYTWTARFVNFFMVIAAVGVVSIPSGVIASGFVEIVQSKQRARQRGRRVAPAGIQAGDDWYEIRYRSLQGIQPPPSGMGPAIDAWQLYVNEFLNGKRLSSGRLQFGIMGYVWRIFMLFMIVANVVAVILDSIPWIDKAVGNKPGNFFDQFEALSVFVFTTEYILRLFCAPKNREALYSSFIYATTFFGIVDVLSTLPWFVEQYLIYSGNLDAHGDTAKIFRIFRIFRIFQLEDFVTAFSKLDNVFRASRDVLKATGLLALIIWVVCGALFFIFEENNPNWRECDPSVPISTDDPAYPGCYDFPSTAACNRMYPGLCKQTAFQDMVDSLFYTAVFLGGEWGVVDFTWPGRVVCLFLCVVGIGLYAIPVGTLFDSFGAVLGLGGDDDDDGDADVDESKKND